MTLPFPPAIASLLTEDETNLSLFFDRAFDGYEQEFEVRAKEGRQAFFEDLTRRFETGEERASEEYRDRQLRRQQALESQGAVVIEMKSTQPLVLGLGLPHPTETGFLLDRHSGVPYIPGSSVKGLLRAVAGATLEGELPVDELHQYAESYWRENLSRIFGPEIEGSTTPSRGEVRFYDAFPSCWPRLVVDILTPHHGDYYGSGGSAGIRVAPGDWHEPIPNPFLTVAPDTPFWFAFGPRRRGEMTQQEFRALYSLLVVGLDWIGIGGKARSQGYGAFEEAGIETDG